MDGDPGNARELVSLEDNLNVLLPFLNLSGGGGLANGSLKKNDP